MNPSRTTLSIAISFVAHAAAIAGWAWLSGGTLDSPLGSSGGLPSAETDGSALAHAWTVSLVPAAAGAGVESISRRAPFEPAPAVAPRPSAAAVDAAASTRHEAPAHAATTTKPAPPARANEPSAPLSEASAPAPDSAARMANASSSPAGTHAGAPGGDAEAPAAEGAPRGVWPGAGQVDRAARPSRPIRPAYPTRARRRGEESTVVVQAWVDARGEVAFASVIESGGEEFDDSARFAVHRSRFEPALLRGESVASRVALRIHFDLYD